MKTYIIRRILTSICIHALSFGLGRKHPEHERKEYMQKIEKKNSVESDDNLSSSFGDELHIDGSQTHKQNGRKPLTQHNLRTPNAYKQGQLYKEKQKLLEKAQLKKDRDQRKFHAKPAPNFNAIHAANSKKRVQEDPKITVPRTPQVIRSHRIYSGMAEAKVSIKIKCCWDFYDSTLMFFILFFLNSKKN